MLKVLLFMDKILNKAYAFFFDADNSELSFNYGKDCTAKIISAIELSKLPIKTQILRGNLLPYSIAYQMIGVSTTENILTQYDMSPNMELYKTMLCDLIDSFETDWHTFEPIKFLFTISKTNIWTIVLPSITIKVAEEIDKKTRSFNPYIGATIIDRGNPLHMKLFTLLIDGAYIDNSNFYYRSDNIEEDKFISELYGSTREPILIESNDFYNNIPESLSPLTLSERGSLSLARFNGKSKLSHSQKLVYSLVDFLKNNPNIKEFSYQSKFDIKNQNFICEENKIKNYLLDLNHPHGGAKAKFFIETLGIERDDWRYLANQISSAMNNALIFEIKNNQHGIRHSSFIKIKGRNNREAIIQTVWIIKEGESPRLVTAYPYNKEREEELKSPQQNIVPVDLTGDEKWKKIYELAHNAGEIASHTCIPTPMIFNGSNPIFEGYCGFAWITIFDARKGMARWLKKNNIGSKNYKSGWDVFAHPIPNKDDTWDVQSIEPKEAYARAFEKILLDNGIQCQMESRYD